MTSVAVQAYAALSYIYFLWVHCVALAFIGNVSRRFPQLAALLPYNIDNGVPCSSSDEKFGCVITNILLLGVFAVQHTIMARPSWKRMYTAVLPKETERSTFVLLACITLHVAIHFWRPLPTLVYDVPALDIVLFVGSVLGWGVILLASFSLDHLELFGLRQAFLKPRSGSFQTTWLYSIARHPLMTGWFITFWSTATMTEGHLLFSIVMSLYIVIAVYIFEEPDLVKEFGSTYKEYQATTAAFCPIPMALRKKPKSG